DLEFKLFLGQLFTVNDFFRIGVNSLNHFLDSIGVYFLGPHEDFRLIDMFTVNTELLPLPHGIKGGRIDPNGSAAK
ncbi:hypothetical protein, partial [Eubacterium aggregans]|uniref:hypothetical protein n=1 Tax=Eubacterium aggregans TaxID=81409 RepID=UPI003F325F07